MKGSTLMSDLQKYKQKQLKDPAFRAEYELTRPEFEVMRVLIDARISQNMTQKDQVYANPISAGLKTVPAARPSPRWKP